MAERDPRVDPKPGDVLRKSAFGHMSIYQIASATPRGGAFVDRDGTARLYISPKRFPWWAASAEVVRKGSE